MPNAVSKVEVLETLVKNGRDAAVKRDAVKAEWAGKPLSAFVTSQADGVVHATLPIIDTAWTGGDQIFITVPKFEGLGACVKLSRVSVGGKPSEIQRHLASPESEKGFIKVYSKPDVLSSKGERVWKLDGLMAIDDLVSVTPVKVERTVRERRQPVAV
jgi:hypothetical protein